MTSRVGSPWYLRSCGASPIEAIGKISVSSPISVSPSTTTEAPIRQRAADPAPPGPITQLRTDRGAAADAGAGVHDRRGMDARRAGLHRQQQPWLPRPAGRRRRRRRLATARVARRRPSATSSRRMSPGTTPRRKRPLSTPRSDTVAVEPGASWSSRSTRGRLRQRFDHQHRRHQRLARKVALEELLTDGEVLGGDEPASRLVFQHDVDETRREARREPVEERRDVQDARSSGSGRSPTARPGAGGAAAGAAGAAAGAGAGAAAAGLAPPPRRRRE